MGTERVITSWLGRVRLTFREHICLSKGSYCQRATCKILLNVSRTLSKIVSCPSDAMCFGLRVTCPAGGG